MCFPYLHLPWSFPVSSSLLGIRAFQLNSAQGLCRNAHHPATHCRLEKVLALNLVARLCFLPHSGHSASPAVPQMSMHLLILSLCVGGVLCLTLLFPLTLFGDLLQSSEAQLVTLHLILSSCNTAHLISHSKDNQSCILEKSLYRVG